MAAKENSRELLEALDEADMSPWDEAVSAASPVKEKESPSFLYTPPKAGCREAPETIKSPCSDGQCAMPTQERCAAGLPGCGGRCAAIKVTTDNFKDKGVFAGKCVCASCLQQLYPENLVKKKYEDVGVKSISTGKVRFTVRLYVHNGRDMSAVKFEWKTLGNDYGRGMAHWVPAKVLGSTSAPLQSLLNYHVIYLECPWPSDDIVHVLGREEGSLKSRNRRSAEANTLNVAVRLTVGDKVVEEVQSEKPTYFVQRFGRGKRFEKECWTKPIRTADEVEVPPQEDPQLELKTLRKENEKLAAKIRQLEREKEAEKSQKMVPVRRLDELQASLHDMHRRWKTEEARATLHETQAKKYVEKRDECQELKRKLREAEKELQDTRNEFNDYQRNMRFMKRRQDELEEQVKAQAPRPPKRVRVSEQY